MKHLHKVYFVSLVVVFFCLFVFIFIPLSGSRPIVVYSDVYIAASIVFLFISAYVLTKDLSIKFVLILLGASVLLRVALAFVAPTGSDDYYRYLWDGKVMASGINPYRYAPDDPALSSLHSSVLPARVNFRAMRTVYPPLAEGLFYAAYRIGGESYLGIKLLLFVFDLMTMYGIYLILRKLKLSTKNLLLYGLCPLPLFQFFIDGHVDGFGLTFLVFSAFFYIDGKKLLSYIFIALSICVKPTGLVMIPLILIMEKDIRERVKVVLVPAGICAASYLPFVLSGSPFQGLVKFTENWWFNGFVFDILNAFTKDNQVSRSLCGALFVLAFAVVVFSRKDFLTKLYTSIFLLLIFSPVVHPWYLGWLAVLIPFRARWSGLLYVALVSLTSITVVNYQLTGAWNESTVVLLLEYLPVLAVFILELVRTRNQANPLGV